MATRRWPAPLGASATDARARGAVDSDRVAGHHDPVRDPLYPAFGHPEIDALHYWLDLRWDGTTLCGRADLDLRVARDTSDLRLDLAPGLTVSAADLSGRPVAWTRSGHVVTFATGSLRRDAVRRLHLTYSGRPAAAAGPSLRAGLDRVGWKSDGSRVWTVQEPYGAFTWYPVNDHPSDKAVYDVRVTTTNGTVGVSGGVPVAGLDRTDGRTVVRAYHLGSPAASYLVTLAIGDYTPHRLTLRDGRTWTTWATPDDADALARVQTEAPRAYDAARAVAGRYPFASVGVVLVPDDISMETQTLVTLGTRTDPHQVLTHELAHQWYGDLATARTWQDLWLTEGWAMHVQALDSGLDRGELEAGCRAGVADGGQPAHPAPDRFAAMNVYYCLPVALDQIRSDVGRDRWQRLAAAWPAEHADQTVDRGEFTRWLRARTGRDYSALLARWLDHVG